jgi:glucosylceramidase
VQAGASGWIYWNLLLNAQGGPFAYSPQHGDSGDNFQQPIVVVDAPSFHPTALFYFLAHFSRFVRPGVARLGTREAALPEGVSAVAFEAPAEEQHTPSPNGAVLQLVNRATSERQVTVCSGERIAEVMLPATSITTAMWSA